MTGSGANIWAKVDAFHFLYTKLSGDLTFTADVHFEGNGVEHHRKAALMIRQSLDLDSPYAEVALHGDGLTSLQYRSTVGAETAEIRSDVKGPVRIRIERHGNQFTIGAGNPDEELKTSGPMTVQLTDPVYVGLAVSSHNADVLETANTCSSTRKVTSGNCRSTAAATSCRKSTSARLPGATTIRGFHLMAS